MNMSEISVCVFTSLQFSNCFNDLTLRGFLSRPTKNIFRKFPSYFIFLCIQILFLTQIIQKVQIIFLLIVPSYLLFTIFTCNHVPIFGEHKGILYLDMRNVEKNCSSDMSLIPLMSILCVKSWMSACHSSRFNFFWTTMVFPLFINTWCTRWYIRMQRKLCHNHNISITTRTTQIGISAFWRNFSTSNKKDKNSTIFCIAA